MPVDRLEPVPWMFPHADKVAHFVMYGLYAVLLIWAFDPRRRERPRQALAGVLGFCVAYGAAMEVMQLGLSSLGRSFSPADLAANILGVAVVGFERYWSSGLNRAEGAHGAVR